MDLIAAYALPIPLTVISEMLDPRRRPAALPQVVERHRGPHCRVERVPERCRPSGSSCATYARVIAAKRAQPQDDLISALVQAEEAGERLREDELVAMVFLLVVAGHETTVNLIGNGALALPQFLEQLARLRNDPALDATAVEELLRFHSPVEV